MGALELEPAAAADDVARDELLAQIRDRLLAKLRRQREHALEMYAWYEGEQDPPNQPVDPAYGYSGAFNRLRRMARGAWARLIVDALTERLELQGIRTTLGQDADDAAWTLLQDNHIDADQHDVYAEAFITGHTYVSVGASDAGGVRIAPETVLEVTHEHAPGDRRATTAALKLFQLLEGGPTWVAELYTADEVAVWTAELPRKGRTPLGERTSVPWHGPTVAGQPLGAVPFVTFANRPTAATPGEGELRELIPVMQRLDELQLAKMVAAHTSIFRQKWATGMQVPKDPDTGKPVSPFKESVERVWISEKEGTRFGSFEATDIAQYLKAIDSEIAELAAISRIPSYYLVQSELANPPSADSLIAGEAGLVSKLRDRQRGFGESWEQVVRLAAQAGDQAELAGDRQLEMVWAPLERRSPAVIADAATKLDSIDVPWATLMELIGFSPQAIERMRTERAAEALLEPILEPAGVGAGQ